MPMQVKVFRVAGTDTTISAATAQPAAFHARGSGGLLARRLNSVASGPAISPTTDIAKNVSSRFTRSAASPHRIGIASAAGLRSISGVLPRLSATNVSKAKQLHTPSVVQLFHA